MQDLYAIPLRGVSFTRMCGGNQGNDNDESCVTITSIEGVADGVSYALGDTKNPEADGASRFTKAELDAFVIGYARQAGLLL